MPLTCLVRQAGWHGYLLLAGSLLPFLTARGRSEGYDAVDASAAIQIVYALVIFLAAASYLASPRGRQARTVLLSRPSVYLVSYIGMCIFSFAWSERPLYSAFMGFECLAHLVLITVVLDRLRVRCTAQDMVEWVLFWVVWQIGCRLLFRAAHGGFFYSVFRAAAFQTGIAFFLAAYIGRRRVFRWIVMTFALLSGINTLYASMIPGMYLGVFSKNRILKGACLLGAVAVVMGVAAFGMESVMQETIFRNREGIGMEYTSGRDTLWEQSLEYIAERPLLGYGFVSGERDRMLVGGVSVMSVHNMLLSAALGVGVLGPVLLLVYFVETFLLCLNRQLPQGWRAGFLATVSSAFIFSMANPGLGGRVYGAWMVAVCVMTMIGMYCRMQPIRMPRWRMSVVPEPGAIPQRMPGRGHRASLEG